MGLLYHGRVDSYFHHDLYLHPAILGACDSDAFPAGSSDINLLVFRCVAYAFRGSERCSSVI